MSYLALYREWRPQTFSDVVGQQHVVTTLCNALRLGRVAHAYLFSGPRGTGKTSLAKILAKAVNCEAPVNGVEPCNECPACTGILAGRVVDVTEMDAASNRGVDEIRSLLDQVRYAPTEVRMKVYIIDEVHMLTQEAFNALLKTLEEPPDYCLFILATTEAHKVPATIVSRCQRFDFGRVRSELVVERLRKIATASAMDVEDAALWYIARATEGGLRDALSLLDQVVSFAQGRIGVEQVATVLGGLSSEQIGVLFGCVWRQEQAALLTQLGEIWERGYDPGQLVADCIEYGRDAILRKSGVHGAGAEERSHYDPTFALVVDQAEASTVFVIVDRLAQLQSELRYQAQARLFVEVGLLALSGAASASAQVPANAAAGSDVAGLRREIGALTERIAQLEQRLSAPSTSVPQASTAKRTRNVPESPGDAPAVPRQEDPAPAVVTAPKGTKTESKRSSDAISVRPGALTPQTMGADEQAGLAALQSQWNALLDELKQRSVQTRAWLHAGRPVAWQQGTLVVAFKSALHAETVMKSPHKELIEEATSARLRAEVKLRAVMEDAWEAMQVAPVQAADDEATSSAAREPWVEKVIEWFGEEHVTVLDE